MKTMTEYEKRFKKAEAAKKVAWVAGALIAIILVLLGRATLNKAQREYVWLGLLIYFYAVLGWVDYTAMYVMPHDFTLQTIQHLMSYWMSLATVYVALAFIVTWHSYMYTDSIRNAARHGLISFFFLIGAFADWFFFLIDQGVPALDSQWFWMWQGIVFGWWTGYAQIAWSLWMVVLTIAVWIWVRDKNTSLVREVRYVERKVRK